MKKWLLILAAVMAVAVTGCGSKKKPAVIFHADALTVPMSDIVAEYEKLHPNVQILAESQGSVLCAKLAKKCACDILMVADARIIAEMEPEHAEWNATFATNEIVIAYAQKSKFGAEINPQNWYDVLTRPGVTFAHANPEYDPAGYWTLIVWELADLHYGATVNGKPISEALKAARTEDSIKPDAHQMLNLIDSRSGIDYGFVYMNQAVEQNMKIVRLPKEINLSDPALAELYSKVRITEPIDKTGAPIAFSMTLLKQAPQREEALKFLKFVLGERGRALLRSDRAVAAFNVMHPPLVDIPGKVPPGLAEVMGLGR